jgi:hypothetical protein
MPPDIGPPLLPRSAPASPVPILARAPLTLLPRRVQEVVRRKRASPDWPAIEAAAR